jgi:hypothetical protein
VPFVLTSPSSFESVADIEKDAVARDRRSIGNVHRFGCGIMAHKHDEHMEDGLTLKLPRDNDDNIGSLWWSREV